MEFARSLPQEPRGSEVTPEELGDTLARLVWESFSDFLAKGDTEVSIQAEGKRFKHEPTKVSWISCAIFCKTDKKQW